MFKPHSLSAPIGSLHLRIYGLSFAQPMGISSRCASSLDAKTARSSGSPQRQKINIVEVCWSVNSAKIPLPVVHSRPSKIQSHWGDTGTNPAPHLITCRPSSLRYSSRGLEKAYSQRSWRTGNSLWRGIWHDHWNIIRISLEYTWMCSDGTG